MSDSAAGTSGSASVRVTVATSGESAGPGCRGDEWSETSTVPGGLALADCPSGYDGQVRVRCDETSRWERADYSECIAREVQNIRDNVSRVLYSIGICSMINV